MAIVPDSFYRLNVQPADVKLVNIKKLNVK